MADPKEGESFFRKVVRFVANPATDWNEISAARPDDGLDLERSELKAMIERKRRNDFVRKREFDTLRRLRREGLSPEQLAALGGSSKVDDSEVRLTESSGARAEIGVKAKIDEIEQQMVGNGGSGLPAASPVRRPPADPRPPRPTPNGRPTDFYSATTQPVPLASAAAPAQPQPPLGGLLPGFFTADSASGAATPARADGRDGRDSLGAAAGGPDTGADQLLPPLPPLQDTDAAPLSLLPARPVSDAAVSGWDLAPDGRGGPAAEARPSLPQADLSFEPNSKFAVEVSEVVHDPELDEAVIAFANADFHHSEQALEKLRRAGGPRHQHADTWLVLFDLHRATGQQAKFEALALDYANQFGRSAPQWFSLPKLVADAAAQERPDTRGVKGVVGWVSPALLDAEAVARLQSTTLQLPLPWVLDWSGLQRIEPDAAAALASLLRQWAPQRLDMRWLAADLLLATLQEAAPTGVRDADPAYWMARLEALRLSNRPDQFDETAIDYCVTYEVSPPSWEKAQCQVRASASGMATTAPPLSIISEMQSSFLESGLNDDPQGGPRVAAVELSGQLSGDIAAVLGRLDRSLGGATVVQVSCARLIRVDFVAAGDLLNWVLAKRSEQRGVTFADAHRLVALFFGAMGINEHARVQVPRL
jgi:hypothetical protein